MSEAKRKDFLDLVQWQTAGKSPWLDDHVKSMTLHLRRLWEFYQAWRQTFYHFRALRPGTAHQATLSSESVLDPTGHNLPAVLLDLQTNRPHLFADLRALIAEIVPDVGRLETPTEGSRMEVTFADPYRPGFQSNVKDLGTGVEQLLMSLVVGLTQRPPFLLVVEEPETNLHPAAQRALLGLFQAWGLDRQIIVATHSAVMVDWSPGGDRLWLVTRTKGVSHVALVDSEPLDLLRALGVRLSDVLSAERILIVEGASDEDVLSAWFPDLLRDPRLAVIAGGGGDDARHAELLTAWLDQADQLQRRVLYVRDRDELPASTLDKLTSSRVVHVLNRRELENYLLDPHAVTAVLKSSTTGRPAPTTAEVKTAMVNAAENLRMPIIINRVCRQLPVARLMSHRLRQRLVRDRAAVNAVTAAVLQQIPNPDQLREDIVQWWQDATDEVSTLTGDDLLTIAPGADVLDAVFLAFLGRHFDKRLDGVAIAQAMLEPPADLKQVLDVFLSE